LRTPLPSTQRSAANSERILRPRRPLVDREKGADRVELVGQRDRNRRRFAWSSVLAGDCAGDGRRLALRFRQIAANDAL